MLVSSTLLKVQIAVKDGVQCEVRSTELGTYDRGGHRRTLNEAVPAQ